MISVSEFEILYSATNIALRLPWQHCVPDLRVTEAFQRNIHTITLMTA